MQRLQIEKISKKDFEWLKWKKEDVEKIPQNYKKHLKQKYFEIKKIKKKERTFQNTVLALEYANGEFEEMNNQINLLINLSPDEKIRNTAFLAQIEISKILTNLYLDKNIYKALLEYKSKNEKLNKVDKKLLDEYIKNFKDLGFDLKEEKQKEVKKIIHRINILSSKFFKNINDYQDSIILPKNQTQGLSENYLKTLNKDKNGNYIVTLSYSDFGTFISKSENENLRKEILEKNSKKGGKKNLKILNEILDLKKRKAIILGYRNHAQYVLGDRMAKSPETVKSFLNNIYNKIKKESLKDENELLDFKIKNTKNKKDKLYAHDLYFYTNKLREERFSIDSEKIREYFVLENVLKNMFKIFGNLFDFKVEELNKKLWHKDAKMFVLKRKNKDIAYIAMDLFPREGKYSHACMTSWKEAGNTFDQKSFKLPITVLICNFRKSTKKIPSLLSLGEVETIFHEFGHALHNSLTKAKYPSFVGTNVKWDFIELPSQLLENWLLEEKILKTISRHYKTGKSFSKKMIENIINSNKFQKGSFYSDQIRKGILDLTLHTKGHKKPEKLFLKLCKESSLVIQYKDNLFPASFGHIVGGYGAGYYSYLWSEVYSDHVFSEFKKNNFSKKIGKKYREEILEKGSEREESESIKKFLGRNPNNKAFLKKIK